MDPYQVAPAEQEYEEANRLLERETWETLDRCYSGKASREDWLFLAWQTGATKWSPPNNVIQLRRQ